uniref:Uncharacterized protein n=1 Tax=Arundo donax TaxID=35708 RepID=A0A0A8YG32_ARUDO
MKRKNRSKRLGWASSSRCCCPGFDYSCWLWWHYRCQ